MFKSCWKELVDIIGNLLNNASSTLAPKFLS